MGMGPSGPGTPARPVFSPDGFWWWDGREWRPAVSPDRLWRWNGQAWEPNRATPAAGTGTGAAVAITLVVAAGIFLLVVLIVAGILYTMGNQISNVFSNVVAALGSPSP